MYVLLVQYLFLDSKNYKTHPTAQAQPFEQIYANIVIIIVITHSFAG